MSSNLPTLLIDLRNGSAVMRLANGETLGCKLDINPAELTGTSSPWCSGALARIDAQSFERAQEQRAACDLKVIR